MDIKSLDFTNVVRINSERIKERKRKIEKDYMIYADVFGNCCWEVRSKYPNGGQSEQLITAKLYTIPFAIKSVRKIRC